MSKTTIALEAAVAAVIASTPEGDVRPTARQRAEVDKAFARILKLIAPRIRHFIRQYGLVGHWEDAEQACAIAVHRAIQAYEPEKAQFTTFVNWQIRGELQSLRFRLMADQRPSAKKVEATTVSLNAIAHGAEGEETTLESVIEDENALALTESAASDYLADAATSSLVDSYIDHLRTTAIDQLRRRARPKKRELARAAEGGAMLRSKMHGIDAEELEKLEERLTRNRDIVVNRLFGMGASDAVIDDAGVTKERVRQITKRAAKTIAELAGTDPKFVMMAEYRKVGVLRANEPKPRVDRSVARMCPPVTILPEASQPVSELPRLSAAVPDGIEHVAIDIAAMDVPSTLRH
ncbi:sigma-70 family RNA polymerase sigma factor [Sphingomonas sp. LaA6.9]|uniref:sigma-70 family RNA polymerase sigma factor n=1 Tax=Sphingomonas sp. LaA6.9 TaxID=2919914 RepID=UPI001F50353C|nr:sigma-70 family RNA polymerase sigma factor [Sphingomonas sp. LaA6.9]MCJ8157725.1 sigma-70 family RNA polymerase sigma factor [Sphingomonas sp. LaA6.9]